jgi:transcriptional regulator of acetoin/glycerol metabolism
VDTVVPQVSAASSLFADKRDWFERLCRARESFLTTGSAAAPASDQSGIRLEVVESWRRSLRYGLNPGQVAPVAVPGVDLDGQLTRVVSTVVAPRMGVLEESMCALSLSDNKGSVLAQWVGSKAFGSWLEAHGIMPGASLDEAVIGTSSGICLLSGKPTMVRGPEHFSEAFSDATCAGAPVTHPTTRRLLGSLNLTCRYEDTSPVLLSWVTELARDVERAFQDLATRRERVLLDAYLVENRDARHPVVALNEQTIITNATAARLLESVDQALLWEHACRAIQQRQREPQRLVLTNGTVILVECREVAEVAETAGAVLKIRPVVERAAGCEPITPTPALGGLVGLGSRWRELCRRAQLAGDGWALITGERGVGKLAVAKAMAGNSSMTVLDAADAAAAGSRAWLAKVSDLLLAASPGSVLVIRHADELARDVSTAAANLLRAHRDGGVRVLATATEGARHISSHRLLSEFTATIEVPAMRDRIEDLPVLLEALTAVAFGRLALSPRPVRWMPDAVQTLTRLDWPSNVASLEALVLEVVQSNRTGYVGAKDLPADVVARASRRRLAGLEQVEAMAIIAALRDAGGNKNQAADALGIARSTLYRKVRALGIDLSTMTF